MGDLEKFLHKQWVDTSSWWKGVNKSLTDLEGEVEAWESILKVIEWKVVRFVQIVDAIITYPDETWDYKLIEEKQVFENWNVRVRNHLWFSIAEKVEWGEHPFRAIIRGIKEELGIIIDFDSIKYWKIITEDSDSSSYPWLESQRTIQHFHINFHKNYYNKDGYKEVQKWKKTTYFKWVRK